MSPKIISIEGLRAGVEPSNIVWDSNLGPNVDEKRIAVNVSRTEQFLGHMGIASLIIEETWDVQKANFNSVDRSDKLVDDLFATLEAVIESTNLTYIRYGKDASMIGVIVINRYGLGKRIADGIVDLGMDREAASARALDDIMRRGLIVLNQDALIEHIANSTLSDSRLSQQKLKYRHKIIGELLRFARGFVQPTSVF